MVRVLRDGQGSADPHRPALQGPVYGDNERDEVVFFDWAFNKSKDDENNLEAEADTEYGSSLVV